VLDFRVEVDRTPECVVVRILGELDIATAPQVVEALDSIDGDTPRVAVDLLDTSFIDSTGLTTLFRAHKRYEDRERDFSLVVGPRNVEVLRVIDLMGFDEVFTIFATLDEAGCQAPDGPVT
jgi:anti-sigma B factor antagonist